MTLTAKHLAWRTGLNLPDWLPPTLVKALRQSLRSHVFGILLVWTQVSLGLLVILQAADVWHWINMFVVLVVIVPLWPIGMRDDEMRSESLDLVRLTLVSPRSLVDGKLMCVLVHGLLLALTMAPYRLISHYLAPVGGEADIEASIWLLANMTVLAPWGIFVGASPMAVRLVFVPLLLGALLLVYGGLLTILRTSADGIWLSWSLIASVGCMVGCNLAVASYGAR